MPFATKTQEQYLDELLASLSNVLPNVDVSDASDERFRMAAIAHVLEGLSARQDWTKDQIFPDSSDEENLERWAATRDITKQPASIASGTLNITGTDGTPITLGSPLTKPDGVNYITTGAAVWDGGGNATITVEATTAGAAGNLSSGATLTWSPTISGIDAAATVDSSGLVGGTEEEEAASLLVRYLADLQDPPAGGKESDWVRWALEVPGVEEAFAFPLRRGLGTVDLVCFTVDIDGDRANPGPSLVTAIETYIDSVRPVTVKDWQLVEPDDVTVDVDITGVVAASGYDDATVAAAAAAAVEAFFPTLAPGGELYLTTQLHPIIAAVEGMLDYSLDDPSSNVTATVNPTTIELLVAGTVSASP